MYIILWTLVPYLCIKIKGGEGGWFQKVPDLCERRPAVMDEAYQKNLNSAVEMPGFCDVKKSNQKHVRKFSVSN